MSLVVSPVSKISFRSQGGDAVSQPTAEDILSRPGTYTKPAEQAATESAPTNHNFLKALAKTVLVIGIISGALYGLKRGFPNVFKVTENIKDLNGMDKIKALLTTGIAKGAEYVEQGAKLVAGKCSNAWDGLLKLLKIRK